MISLMFWRKYERCIVGGIVNKFSFATRTLILVGNNFYSTRFGSLYVHQYIPKSIDERWGVLIFVADRSQPRLFNNEIHKI